MTKQISLALAAAALVATFSAPAFAALAPVTGSAPAATTPVAIAQDMGIVPETGNAAPAAIELALRAR